MTLFRDYVILLPRKATIGSAGSKPPGGVAERLMAAVLKTVVAQATVGSNPTPSASIIHRERFNFTKSHRADS